MTQNSKPSVSRSILYPKEAIDILEDRVDDLEKAVELHTQQINELKKAQ